MDIKLDYSQVRFQENGRLKLLIIVGTRPEIIRLAAVINKCRSYFDCLLAHTGQNYDYNLNGVFFRDLKLKFTLPYAGQPPIPLSIPVERKFAGSSMEEI